MKLNKAIWVVITIVVLVAFIAYSVRIITTPIPEVIQGEVNATQIKVSSKLAGRIDSLIVKKGQKVDKDVLLFTLTSPEVDAKLSQAEAARSAAKAQENKAHKGARSEDIQAAYNTWQKAKAAADYASVSFKRIENLHKEGVVPTQKRDEVEMKMKAAQKTERAAFSIYTKAKNGAREEDKQAAEALVRRAEGVIEEVNNYKSEARIFAPRKGEVANIIAEEGELVPQGFPVVTLVDLEDIWVTFNIREDRLKHFLKGRKITARIPALGIENIELKVSYVHVLGDYATWTATKASGDFDKKTFEVHATPTQKLKDLRPGMSVLVDLDTLPAEN